MRLPSRRAQLLALLGVLLVAGGVGAFFLLFEKRTVEVDVLPSGPARSDPYYALRLYLEERGLRVESTRRWVEPPAGDTAVFWFNDDPVPDDVRDWLGEGGQLWAFDDPDGRLEWEPTPWVERDAGVADRSASPSAQAASEGADAGDAGVAQADEPVQPVQGDLASPEPEAVDAGAPQDGGEAGELWEPICAVDDYACWQRVDAEWALEICGDDQVPCLYAAQFDYGAGCLTLVEPDTLRNADFVDAINAARVDALLGCPTPPRAVILVRGLESPWIGELLAEHAPGVLFAAAVLLWACLWRAAVFIGPQAPLPAAARRSWMEHVQAVGALAARTGLEPLVRGARAELMGRLRLRMPELAHLPQAQIAPLLGARLRLPEAVVQRALTEAPRGTPAHTLSLVRDMLELWRTL